MQRQTRNLIIVGAVALTVPVGLQIAGRATGAPEDDGGCGGPPPTEAELAGETPTGAESATSGVGTSTAGLATPVPVILIGNPDSGVVAYNLTNRSTLNWKKDLGGSFWGQIVEPPGCEITRLTGSYSGGLVVSCRNVIDWKKLSDIGGSSWANQKRPMATSGMTGGLVRGLISFNNYDVSRLVGSNWVALPRAPFTIKGAAGDAEYGVVIYGGEDDEEVAVMDGFGSGARWTTLSRAPFSIKGMTGDAETGPIIWGGKEIRYLEDGDFNDSPKKAWREMPDAPETINEATGLLGKGSVFVGNDGRTMYATKIELVVMLPKPSARLVWEKLPIMFTHRMSNPGVEMKGGTLGFIKGTIRAVGRKNCTGDKRWENDGDWKGSLKAPSDQNKQPYFTSSDAVDADSLVTFYREYKSPSYPTFHMELPDGQTYGSILYGMPGIDGRYMVARGRPTGGYAEAAIFSIDGAVGSDHFALTNTHAQQFELMQQCTDGDGDGPHYLTRKDSSATYNRFEFWAY